MSVDRQGDWIRKVQTKYRSATNLGNMRLSKLLNKEKQYENPNHGVTLGKHSLGVI